MRNLSIQKLDRRFIFLTVLVFAFATLQGCGSVTRGKEEPLQISLQVPAGEDPEFFWYGVQTKTLRIVPKDGEAKDLPWDSGSKLEIDLREGDKLEFLGTDHSGLLLVTGNTVVGEEKKITIELRRVL